MTTSADLYAGAAELGRKARDCDDTADDLELHVRPLDGVLAPIAELHTADTWSSMAADNSRRTLAWQHMAAVDAVRGEVAELIRLLRAMAEGYRSDQRLVRGRADGVAADERRAAAEAAAPPEPAPPGDRPPGGGGGSLTFN